MEWSYGLLGDEARRLLAACSVFRGGVPLGIIEPVCTEAGTGVAVLDGSLQELVHQSLLRPVRARGAPRYLMLETIREFAAERLAGTPQAARLRGAHAAAFLALAGEAGRPLTGRGQKDWLERLDVEHNNIRAAIDWYRQEDPPAALRLAAAMSMFWSLHGHYTEGRQLLRQLLGLVPDQTTVRVRALNGAAWLAIDQGDYPDADRLLSESTELSGRLNDKVGEGMAAAFLCRSMLSSGRVAEAAPYSRAAYAALTEADDRPGIAFALFYLALHAQFTGSLEAACDLHERCAAMCRELGFASLRARALQLLGITRLLRGDLMAARAALQEELPASVDLGDRFVIPIGKPRLSLDLSRNGTRFGFMLDIPQHQTECLLRARVAELGGVTEQLSRADAARHRSAQPASTASGPQGRRGGQTARDYRRLRAPAATARTAGSVTTQASGSTSVRTSRPQLWPASERCLALEQSVHHFFRATRCRLVCVAMRRTGDAVAGWWRPVGEVTACPSGAPGLATDPARLATSGRRNRVDTQAVWSDRRLPALTVMPGPLSQPVRHLAGPAQ